MVPKWLKIAKKQEDAQKLLDAIDQIYTGDFEGLDIMSLAGKKGFYRCRIGKMRIIFYEKENNEYEIDSLGFRGQIYKNI